MSQKSNQARRRAFPPGLFVVAGLMILFGAAEIVTGFRHSFFGISTSVTDLFTIAAAAVGACYAAAGLLILTMKRWGGALAIILLLVVVAGRIALVAAGLYPMNTLEQVAALGIGTGIAVLFAIYTASRFAAFT